MSRAWGSDHDGLSFRVEKMAWVDEGVGRGEERGGGARRRRLRFHLGTAVGGVKGGGGGLAARPLRLGVGKGVGRVGGREVGVVG